MLRRIARHRARCRSRGAIALPAVMACAALVGGTPAAYAESVEDPDTLGDMVTLELATETVEPAPDRTLNDFANTSLTHGPRRVTVRIEYADLKKRAGGHSQDLDVRMVTDAGVRRRLELDAGVGRWAGRVRMFDERWRRLDCTVLHAIDYVANTTEVSFPRRCVARPEWMRFRVYNLIHTDDGLVADDALHDEPLSLQEKPARSARVHRAAAR